MYIYIHICVHIPIPSHIPVYEAGSAKKRPVDGFAVALSSAPWKPPRLSQHPSCRLRLTRRPQLRRPKKWDRLTYCASTSLQKGAPAGRLTVPCAPK